MRPLVGELLPCFFQFRQLLEFALHGRDALRLVAHAPLQRLEPFLRASFLFLPGLLPAQLALLGDLVPPSRMARLRRQRVVAIQPVIIVVRERRAARVARARVEALGLLCPGAAAYYPVCGGLGCGRGVPVWCWLLPTCRRCRLLCWIIVRGRAGAATASWSYRDASPAEGAAGSSRSLRFARWAACETG